MKTIGYARVSTAGQDLDTQELAIRRYCQDNCIILDTVLLVTASSRNDYKKRLIDELFESLCAGDTVVVSEMSRLARSVGQIAVIIDKMIDAEIRLISIKERIDISGAQDMQSKVMVTMFSLFAELERDLISERTKEGLERAKRQGRRLGRPAGSLGRSKLTGRDDQIRKLLELKVTKANIAKICGVSWSTLDNYIKSRLICAR